MPRIRHAKLLGESLARHVLMVYDAADRLICWCGPYTLDEALSHLRKWVAAGWVGPRFPIMEAR